MITLTKPNKEIAGTLTDDLKVLSGIVAYNHVIPNDSIKRIYKRTLKGMEFIKMFVKEKNGTGVYSWWKQYDGTYQQSGYSGKPNVRLNIDSSRERT